MQFSLADQALYQAMDRLEGAGVFDAEPGQRVDVEEPSVVDFARGQPPVAEPEVLPLQQQMERLGLRRPIFAGAIGIKAAFDQIGSTSDAGVMRALG